MEWGIKSDNKVEPLHPGNSSWTDDVDRVTAMLCQGHVQNLSEYNV